MNVPICWLWKLAWCNRSRAPGTIYLGPGNQPRALQQPSHLAELEGGPNREAPEARAGQGLQDGPSQPCKASRGHPEREVRPWEWLSRVGGCRLSKYHGEYKSK